jgi:chaperone modulatory protein CbpM
VPTDVAVVARIRRLRADLSLNYAALGLVMDLLDRIRQLENATASAPRRRPTWT